MSMKKMSKFNGNQQRKITVLYDYFKTLHQEIKLNLRLGDDP